MHQTLAADALNVLGVVAALNRRFYSTFQFKRMRHFVSSLPIAPPNLTERLEAVVAGDERHGIEVLEGLVREVLELVERHYYASGMIDAAENRPLDNGHRDQLLRLVGEDVDAFIAREGVFRDPKPAGCFVVTRT